MAKAKYSVSTGGIYPLAVYKEFPEDALDIPDETYASFQMGEINGFSVIDGEVVSFLESHGIEEARFAKISELDNAYSAAVQVSVVFKTASGISKNYQADNNGPLSSQSVLLKAFTGFNIMGGTPSDFTWISEDNTAVPFTLADLAGLYGVMLTQGDAAFRQRKALKDQVRAIQIGPGVSKAQAVSAIQAIAWPE